MEEGCGGGWSDREGAAGEGDAVRGGVKVGVEAPERGESLRWVDGVLESNDRLGGRTVAVLPVSDWPLTALEKLSFELVDRFRRCSLSAVRVLAASQSDVDGLLPDGNATVVWCDFAVLNE